MLNYMASGQTPKVSEQLVERFVPHDELWLAGRKILRRPEEACFGVRVMSGLQFAVASFQGLVWLWFSN
jgi:hypothetical protein